MKKQGGDKLAERIDWDSIMPMSRYAGGHDDQMKCLLKDVTIIAHYNEGDYTGSVATCVKLNDTNEVVIYQDSYGSCSGCDAWEDANDDDVIQMCRQLACGAYVFPTLEECKDYLRSSESVGFGYDNVSEMLLEYIENGTVD